MINLIVWSKDRACQLHCLLESIEKNAPFFNISIIYRGSSEDYNRGYEIVKSCFPFCKFLPETDFYTQTCETIEKNPSLSVSFSTDDTVIYRKAPISYDILQPYLPKFTNEVFSFRLGLNTIVQNPLTGMLQPPLNKYVAKNSLVFWNRTMYDPLSNYGYPFSMDMHVFHKNLLSELLTQFKFRSSNELESNLHKHTHRITYMSSFEQSIAVNIPMNNLSQITDVGKLSHPLNELNERYLGGYKIGLDSFNQPILGCHQEFGLNFEVRNG